MIRVAITDDHPLLVEGIRNVLLADSSLELFISFTDAHSTLMSQELENADVLLLDINLPDMDGISLCRKLLEIYPELKIIGLTSHKETAFLKNLMKSGARGYLLKNSPAYEIINAIIKVFNDEEYIQEEMKEILVGESFKHSRPSSFLPKLTRREQEILQLISNEFTTQEIANKLFLSSKTVETHRQNMMLKLGVKNSVGLVRTAMEKGLL